MRRSRFVTLAGLLAANATSAGPNAQCHVVEASFVPSDQLQIVAWVEQPDGAFVDTIYITNKVGHYGLGNRPGRFDFNSGPPANDQWPYGRRITTFPVWAHRHGLSWPEVDFQDGVESDPGGAPADESSPELDPPYCRPMTVTDQGWDTGTCASPAAFTDKGVFSATATSLYPPRADLQYTTCGDDPPCDSPSVPLYESMNPFDAVTQATPLAGVQTLITWPADVAPGTYVLFIEVAKEYDFNATYNTTTYPAPSEIPFFNYGVPYRGQPSIVYSVPFTVSDTNELTATTTSYVGYGDPTGATGALNPPDATITTDTPASGASRLELLPGSSALVLVDAKPVTTATTPGAITQLATSNVSANAATVSFIAPGAEGSVGKVSGYEVRVRAGGPMTPGNFASSMLVPATIVPSLPGTTQHVQVTGLLPQTAYWVGVRAYDECHDEGDIAIAQLETTAPVNGEIDACFIATAAYGSIMANDVELLRHFRDAALRSNAFGELFVETYYTFGPPVAGVIDASDLLRATARGALEPIVGRVRQATFWQP
jgi:hypothetical protein